MTFPAIEFADTREAALKAARDFAPQMGYQYAKRRNYVIPGHPYVSHLAPALRTRLISEQELAEIALEGHDQNLARCEKFVQEVYWRTYWRSWLELRPQVWADYGQSRAQAIQGLDKSQAKLARSLECGESGVEVMDNFARELVETGYMHNHARMWFAAFWIHTNQLPWQLGADFFERNLLCACPAANTLSWRWVAGLQTRGKSYLARRSNIEEYADSAYLGQGKGLETLESPKAVALPSETLPELTMPHFSLNFEPPQGRIGLWISEDDLSPETSQLQNHQFVAICTGFVSGPRKSNASNGLRREFRIRAMADTARRAEAHWKSEVNNLEAATPEELSQSICYWAQKQQLQAVVAIKPFVGMDGDCLLSLQHTLNSQSIELVLMRRQEDARLLNGASGGFHKFWQFAKSEMGYA